MEVWVLTHSTAEDIFPDVEVYASLALAEWALATWKSDLVERGLEVDLDWENMEIRTACDSARVEVSRREIREESLTERKKR